MDGELILVTEVPIGVPCRTRLWFSERVAKELESLREGRFEIKLKRCCQSGLSAYEGVVPPVIKHYRDGVCRIGFVFSLFRIIGFYVDGSSKQEFICIDAFKKRGQKLSASERRRIDVVVDIKINKRWRKNEYPRLA